jgi:hypothetical protein
MRKKIKKEKNLINCLVLVFFLHLFVSYWMIWKLRSYQPVINEPSLSIDDICLQMQLPTVCQPISCTWESKKYLALPDNLYLFLQQAFPIPPKQTSLLPFVCSIFLFLGLEVWHKQQNAQVTSAKPWVQTKFSNSSNSTAKFYSSYTPALIHVPHCSARSYKSGFLLH